MLIFRLGKKKNNSPPLKRLTPTMDEILRGLVRPMMASQCVLPTLLLITYILAIHWPFFFRPFLGIFFRFLIGFWSWRQTEKWRKGSALPSVSIPSQVPHGNKSAMYIWLQAWRSPPPSVSQPHLIKMRGSSCQGTDVTEVCEGMKLWAHDICSFSPSFFSLTDT